MQKDIPDVIVFKSFSTCSSRTKIASLKSRCLNVRLRLQLTSIRYSSANSFYCFPRKENSGFEHSVTAVVAISRLLSSDTSRTDVWRTIIAKCTSETLSDYDLCQCLRVFPLWHRDLSTAFEISTKKLTSGTCWVNSAS